MTISGVPVWPVNELNEIVVQAGTGTTSVTGYVPVNQVATDDSTNKVVMKLPDLDAIVLAEPITGFVSGAGTVGATDTILQAIDKLDGNTNLKALNLLTGYVSGAGTVAATDTVLQGVNKLNGNTVANMLKTEQLLFVKRSADMQLATDQIMTKSFAGTQYRITDIVGVRKTGAASVACLGGIYDAASKGGNAIVAATQNWVSLAAGVMVTATKEALVDTTILTGTPYLFNHWLYSGLYC